jgi:SAM-dependent methyltransferase
LANEYSGRWFRAFLDTVPDDWTRDEVAGIARRLPLPGYRRILDVCCGPGRHAAPLAAAGSDVTGVDRDVPALAQAARRVPGGRFVALDQRALGALRTTFDAAVILWQSFGWFDPATNDRVLADLAALLRPGGRLLLDVYHPGFVRAHAGPTTSPRAAECRSITNAVRGGRHISTIAYRDGSTETMEFELLDPDDLAARAGRCGFRVVETCCWWDADRPPSPEVQRYQLVLELAAAPATPRAG